MSNFRRAGDVNLHPITKEQYEALGGKIQKHNGSFILARGEATNSVHEISVKDKNSMEIKKDDLGRLLIALKEEASLTHTSDHKTIEIPATYYIQIPEREVDNFSHVVKKVID